MKVVIDISEEDYRHAFDYCVISTTRTLGRFRVPYIEEINVDALCQMIRDGKVLPEKYERLLNADDVKKAM